MWSDCTKIALGVKNILKWTISDTFFFYICWAASYCQNMRAIEQIPFKL